MSFHGHGVLRFQWNELSRPDGAAGSGRQPAQDTVHHGLRVCWRGGGTGRQRAGLSGEMTSHNDE